MPQSGTYTPRDCAASGALRGVRGRRPRQGARVRTVRRLRRLHVRAEDRAASDAAHRGLAVPQRGTDAPSGAYSGALRDGRADSFAAGSVLVQRGQEWIALKLLF